MWRISANIFLFVSVFFLPWWLTLFLLCAFIMIFRLYWEGLVAGLFIDLLYAPAPSLSFVSYRFTVGGVILLLLVQFMARRFVRGYEN